MRILCYGDSNTWGYNPANRQRFLYRWSKVLAKLLPEAEIIEEGLNSRTLNHDDPERYGRNGEKTLAIILESQQPLDLVIMMLGSNDLKAIYKPSESQIKAGLRANLQLLCDPHLCDRYPLPQVIVVAPCPLAAGILTTAKWRDQYNEAGYALSLSLAKITEAIAKEFAVAYLNAGDYVQSSEIDSVHLDERNHALLAQAIYQKILDLKKAGKL